MVDLGILLVRVLVGVPMAAHGAQKVFGWFGGYGLKGTGGFLETLGFRPGAMFAAAAGLSELGGGLLLALGLFTPVGAAAMLAAMLVAIVSVHLKQGFFATNNGYELPFLYAAVAVAAAFTGGGAYSLDALFGLRFLAQANVVVTLLVLGVVGAFATLAIRRQPQVVEAAAVEQSEDRHAA